MGRRKRATKKNFRIQLTLDNSNFHGRPLKKFDLSRVQVFEYSSHREPTVHISKIVFLMILFQEGTKDNAMK